MHRPSTACRFVISVSISLPSRGSFQRSLTVLFTIGQIRVFRLSPWSGQIPARLLVPRSTWDTSRVLENVTYRTFTFFGVTFQTLLLSSHIPHRGPATPFSKLNGLACFLFARRYWGNTSTVSFPKATEMFQFASFAYYTYVFSVKYHGLSWWVAPFGDLRINA